MVVPHISRCSGCYLAGRSCDCGHNPMSSSGCFLVVTLFSSTDFSLVQKVNEELSRLEREEASAEDLLLERQRQMLESQQRVAEALARIARLRKMQRSIRKKGVEMLQKGLKDMEELEEAEKREAEEKARQEELERVQAQEARLAYQVQNSCATEVVDFSGFSFDPSMDDLFGDIAQGHVTDPSFSGGTGESNAGTSSGA